MASILFIGFLVLWLAFLGGTIGSFLNVVVYRVPAGMSVSHPPSRCPRCEHAIRWFDNIPVLGWLWLRGRCRDCSLPISPRYPIVEAVTASMFLVVAWADGMIPLWLDTFVTVHGNVEWDDFALQCSQYLLHMLLLCLVWTAALMQVDGHVPPVRMLLGGGVVLLVGMVAVDYYTGPPRLEILSQTAWRLCSGLLTAIFATYSTFFWAWRQEERMLDRWIFVELASFSTWRQNERMLDRWTLVELAAMSGLVFPAISMIHVIVLAVMFGCIVSLLNCRRDFPLLCLWGALLGSMLTKLWWNRGGLFSPSLLPDWFSIVLFSIAMILMTELCIVIRRRRGI